MLVEKFPGVGRVEGIKDELHQLDIETFEVEDLVDVEQTVGSCSCSCSCGSTTATSSCSCSSCCSCSCSACSCYATSSSSSG